MLLMVRRSFVILILLTMFIILLLDVRTVNLQDKFFEPASAQGLINNTIGIQNEAAESTTPLIVKLLAENLENRLNKSAAILEVAGELPQVKNLSYANSISSELHGIPKDIDIAKRKVAQNILAADRDLQVINLLMPNGDTYMVDPYSRQQNLTGFNFAFRDYYKGAVSTADTYLGEVFISASSGLPQSNIAVPLYSSASNNNSSNMTLLGVWAGGLNLTTLSETLQSLNKVLQEQKPGSAIETINGTRMLVFYEPVQFHSTTWAVLLMKPL